MNIRENTAAQHIQGRIPSLCGSAKRFFKALQRTRVQLFFLLFLPAITSAAPFEYISNDAEDTVSVIDTATNSLVATVTVGLGPEGVAVNPMGTRVYVADLGNEAVSVIDTATNTLVATVPVGVDPFGVAVNSAGTRVYVTDLFDNSVSIIDAATNSLLGTVNLGN